MIYILLVIIAVGVLLASKAGQELLTGLGVILAVGGLLYLVFWIVVIAVGLFSDKSLRDGVLTVLGIIMLISYAIYGVCKVYKRLKTKEKRAEIIAKLRNKLKHEWGEHKARFIFVIALILIIIFCWIIVPIYF